MSTHDGLVLRPQPLSLILPESCDPTAKAVPVVLAVTPGQQ